MGVGWERKAQPRPSRSSGSDYRLRRSNSGPWGDSQVEDDRCLGGVLLEPGMNE